MGPEQMGVRINAPKTTTPSKDFHIKRPFIDILYCIYRTVYTNTFCTVHTVYIVLHILTLYSMYFSPLQVKNKPHEGAMSTVHLFLVLLA